MAQQATAGPCGPAGAGRSARSRRTVSGVVLLLPDGDEASAPQTLPAVGDRLRARRSAAGWPARAATDGLAAHVVHYRYRGWNGTEAHLARGRRPGPPTRSYGGTATCPCASPGIGMGGRAALRAAGHDGRQLRAGAGPLAARGGRGRASRNR